MYIIFEPDDPITCPHCEGRAVIALDLHLNGVVGVNKTVEIICGYCSGEGEVQPVYTMLDSEVWPIEPDPA